MKTDPWTDCLKNPDMGKSFGLLIRDHESRDVRGICFRDRISPHSRDAGDDGSLEDQKQQVIRMTFKPIEARDREAEGAENPE